jgi:parvulin-like peptidyl-prolyl isomerase
MRARTTTTTAILALGLAVACGKPPAKTIPGPPTKIAEPAAKAQQAAESNSEPAAPRAATGDPNLPGFIRPTAPVASVNGKPIAADRFNREFDRLVGSGVRIPADRIKHIARNILDRLIEDELRTQAIVRERIELTSNEFEEAWKVHRDRYRDGDGAFDKAQFASNLKRSRITEDELKQRVRRERLARKMVEKLGKITVDRTEIKAFYDNNASSWIERESRDVRPILIDVRPDAGDDAWKAAAIKADKAYAALAKGGDFETIAKQFGDVPREPIHLTRTSAEQALVNAAFKLGVGDVAKPIKTKWGLFVIRLLAKNDERHRPYLEVKAEIERRIRERKHYLEGQRLLREMRKASEVTEKLPF